MSMNLVPFVVNEKCPPNAPSATFRCFRHIPVSWIQIQAQIVSCRNDLEFVISSALRGQYGVAVTFAVSSWLASESDAGLRRRQL
jgi:hypothetical protein